MILKKKHSLLVKLFLLNPKVAVMVQPVHVNKGKSDYTACSKFLKYIHLK